MIYLKEIRITILALNIDLEAKNCFLELFWGENPKTLIIQPDTNKKTWSIYKHKKSLSILTGQYSFKNNKQEFFRKWILSKRNLFFFH